MLLVFGVAFEIPLFVVMLNLAGVVSGTALGRHRAWIVVGVFVFAAVATPSTDPYSMLMLAIPMTVLVLASEVISRILDRRRGRRAARTSGMTTWRRPSEASSRARHRYPALVPPEIALLTNPTSGKGKGGRIQRPGAAAAA